MPESAENLLILARTTLTRGQLAQTQELLDQFASVQSTPAQQLRAEILAHAITVRRDAIPGPECFAEVQSLEARAKDINDPSVLVEAHLLQAAVKTAYGLPVAAVAETVSAVELCVRHDLFRLLDFAVMMQSQLLGIAGLRQELKEFASKWLVFKPPLSQHTLRGLWSGLGTAEFYIAEEQQCSEARQRSLNAHRQDLQLSENLGNDLMVALALSNLVIGSTLAGELPEALAYSVRMHGFLKEKAGQIIFTPANLAWFTYTDGLLLLASGQREAGIALLLSGIQETQEKRNFCLLPLIKIYELLMRHPDIALEGQDLRAWAAELARLHQDKAALQQDLLMKGFQSMVQSAEIAGQNRVLRLHSDQLTRELAQRNQVLNETVTELRAQAMRRERAEAALQQAHDELEQRVIDRTEQLHQANLSLARHERLATQSRMVAGIAHRLNTPLGTAKLAVSTIHSVSQDFKGQMEVSLTRKDLDEYIDISLQSAELAERSLERATELMSVFRQVSTLEHIEQASAFDVQKLVQDACRLCAAELAKTDIPVHLQMTAVAECFGYPQLLMQVLKQVLSNAFLHGQQAQPEGVWIELETHDENLRIHVRDRGPGISEDKLAYIFEPFNSALNSQGVGLGLHIARNLITDLGQGSLTVSSSSGTGSCFTLEFPITVPEVQENLPD